MKKATIDLNDFLIKGYQVFYEPELINQTDKESHIGNKYLLNIFGEWKLIESGYSEKISKDDYITEWHNDSNFGMNITFLYYLDEMSSEIGGSISVRNGITEEEIFPKPGMLLMLSQQKHVEHKVGFTSAQRRVFNFDYLVQNF